MNERACESMKDDPSAGESPDVVTQLQGMEVRISLLAVDLCKHLHKLQQMEIACRTLSALHV